MTHSATRMNTDTRTLEIPAPPMGPLAALTTLEDIAIVSFDVDPDTMARHLPPWLEPRAALVQALAR